MSQSNVVSSAHLLAECVREYKIDVAEGGNGQPSKSCDGTIDVADAAGGNGQPSKSCDDTIDVADAAGGNGQPSKSCDDTIDAIRHDLAQLDPPIHATAVPRGLRVLCGDAQVPFVNMVLKSHKCLTIPSSQTESATRSTRDSVERVLMRRLRIAWDASGSFDVYESPGQSLKGVLTIIIPEGGNQTMMVEVPHGVSISAIEHAWNAQGGKWKSDEVPVEDRKENVLFHVCYIQLATGQCIVWKVKHKKGVPSDDCFSVWDVSRVPPVENAFAGDPDYWRIVNEEYGTESQITSYTSVPHIAQVSVQLAGQGSLC